MAGGRRPAAFGVIGILGGSGRNSDAWGEDTPPAVRLRYASVMVTSRLRSFGTSIFAEMTALAQRHGAINLAQGFPDFDGPPDVVEAAVEALRAGENQYARSMGTPRLVEAVAASVRHHRGLSYDPMTEVLVTSGATEGISVALAGLLEPGDEVLAFEPFYDAYPAAVAMAGGVFKACPLRFPDWALDLEALEALVGPRTRMLMLNTPHNPTGKAFSVAELSAIAELCVRHDLVAVCDEVYEHLTFDGVGHVSLASLPGMRERTLTLSSAGKTFSLTGWKVGWMTGPASLVRAAQAAHQFVTFSTATPLQGAVAFALTQLGDDFYDGLRREFTERRDLLVEALVRAGLTPAPTRGTYFVMASYEALSDEDDLSYARRLVAEVGVAAIPPSGFYASEEGRRRRLLRFAFCKKRGTLEAAAERLVKLAR
jgi:N-succinyldiaminopimelate aminotransferase